MPIPEQLQQISSGQKENPLKDSLLIRESITEESSKLTKTEKTESEKGEVQ
jgi:hypothetical protein